MTVLFALEQTTVYIYLLIARTTDARLSLYLAIQFLNVIKGKIQTEILSIVSQQEPVLSILKKKETKLHFKEFPPYISY